VKVQDKLKQRRFFGAVSLFFLKADCVRLCPFETATDSITFQVLFHARSVISKFPYHDGRAKEL